MPPALIPIVPSAAARAKKKKKKAAAPAAPAAASNDALTVMPTPSTAPATKKGKQRQAHQPLRDANVGKDDQRRKSSHRGNSPRAEVGCRQRHYHQW